MSKFTVEVPQVEITMLFVVSRLSELLELAVVATLVLALLVKDCISSLFSFLSKIIPRVLSSAKTLDTGTAVVNSIVPHKKMSEFF